MVNHIDKKSSDDANKNKVSLYRKYTKFLNNSRAGETSSHVHMESKHGFKGKFTIDSKDQDEFMDLYKQVIFFKDVHLLERQKEVGPLIIDIDFRFKSNTRYNKSIIIDLAEAIFLVVDKYYDLEDEKLELFILEKKSNIHDEEKGEYKDGIHFHMPHLALSSQMRYIIIKDLQKLIDDNAIFENLDSTDDHCEVDKIVDLTVAYKNPWFMYGARKPANIPYKLSKIYNKELEDVKNEYTDEQLVDILSIRKYEDFDIIQPRQSIRESPEFQELIHELFEKKKKVTKIIYDNDVKFKVNPDEVKLAIDLVGVLDKKRADKFEDWIRVGWCLYNIGGYELLDTFRSFSKLNSKKYEPGCCEKVFGEARLGGYTIATLKWWARKDNADKYHEIIDKYINQYLKNAITLTDTDIAKYICEKYKHIVKRTELDWFIFKDGRWRVNRKGSFFSTMVTEELPKDIINLQIHYKTLAKEKEGDEQDLFNKKSEIFEKLIKKIKMRSSKKNIIEEAGDMLEEEGFMNTLDTQLHLIGFDNGVYDLDLGVFREACPDDRITKTVGYDYVEIKETHKDYKNVEKYFKTVFPPDDLRDYALKFLSSLLDGFMRDQKYHMFTGTGANGKSTTVSLLRDTLGDYYVPVPITLFTRKQGSASNASPELMALKGIRAGAMQEPDQGDKMYVGRLKEITGGDQIIGRALFKEMEKFKPQCKIFMTCNNLPDVNTVDNGTWRRIRVVPFDSEFVDKDDVKFPHQFPKDPNLEHNIGKWKQAFMCILLKYYKIYRKDGLKEPEIVIKHTKEYKRNNDIYQEFMDANISVTGKDKDREELDVLYDLFKHWYNSSVPNSKCPKKTDFTNYLTKTAGKQYKIKGKYMYGVIYKSGDGSDGDKFD